MTDTARQSAPRTGASAGPAPSASRGRGGVRGPLGDLGMSELRHPTEPARFALALVALAVAVGVAVFVLISLRQITILLAFFALIIFMVLVIWVAIQVMRIRLLGDAVLVSSQTLPEVQEVVDTVRDRLGYSRRVDLFVVDKISNVLSADAAPITLTTFFGVHVLVAEGEALGDLGSPAERQRLLFTLATYVGALKARYAQWWSPLFTAFSMTGLTVFVFPFVLPYYRATVYSGDRIAHACCGDLEVSLHAVYRALVGKEVAPHLRADGLVGQALTARRRRLLRFAQLWRATPHATNRYLDLLAFVRQRTPDAFETHRAQLGTAGEKAEPVLAKLAGRRPHQNAPVVGIVLAAVALLGGMITGVAFHNSPMAQALADTYRAATSQDSNGGGSDTTSQPSPTESPSASTTETAPSQGTAELLTLVPAGIQGSCTPDTSNATGTLSSLTCHPGGDGPASLSLYAYTDSAAMTSAFKDYVGDLPTGSCSTGEDRQGTWTYSSITQGPLACYVSRAGDATILWGSNDKAVLALAQDTSWTLTQMYTWWINNAPNLQ
jgi:hypothetical protein